MRLAPIERRKQAEPASGPCSKLRSAAFPDRNMTLQYGAVVSKSADPDHEEKLLKAWTYKNPNVDR